MSAKKLPPLIKDRPKPASYQFQQTADMLRGDGLEAVASRYEARAREAKNTEELIHNTESHLRALDDAAAAASRAFPDEDGGLGMDAYIRAEDRAGQLSRWLIEHGWTPPGSLAFLTDPEVSS